MNPEGEVKRENLIYRVITDIELLTQQQKSYIFDWKWRSSTCFSWKIEQEFAIFQGIHKLKEKLHKLSIKIASYKTIWKLQQF